MEEPSSPMIQSLAGLEKVIRPKQFFLIRRTPVFVLQVARPILQDCESYVLAHFARRFGTAKFNLRWMPQSLDSAQKQNRITYPRALLEVLRREQQHNVDHVITGDESWFFLHYPNESVWAESRNEVLVRIKQTIDTEKCLISVL
jgi:hypothetical protein